MTVADLLPNSESCLFGDRLLQFKGLLVTLTFVF